MPYGVACCGVVPVRREPSDSSEMVTQLLLGETVEIQESRGVWHRIKADLDGYTGWASSNQIMGLSRQDHSDWKQHPDRLRSPYRSILARSKGKQGEFLQVPPGACLPVRGNQVDWFEREYEFLYTPRPLKREKLLDTAKGFLGVPYLWGGRTDTGLDCSGFIQTVHLLHGIPLDRDSPDQYRSGNSVGEELADARIGDLLYFRYPDRPVSHIGFYLGEGLLLHASGQVKINQIDPALESSSVHPFNEPLSRGLVGIIRISASEESVDSVSP